ncbi:hypothetical protein GCM10020367_23590 [Streptomyces sannanensis]|uniref:Uncharacterized protein n=1 Tax=Streptomyces sannanensis TaxID=285536 RepID=A0ABP6SAK9_9ACTN
MALPLAFATPASAQPGSSIVRIGSSVAFGAAPGYANGVTVTKDGTNLRVTDTAGIRAGFGCQQVTATTATCGSWATVTQFTASLGDLADSYMQDQTLAFRVILDAGSGPDTVNTGAGGDIINVRDGFVDAVNCDGGSDLVSSDPIDNVALDCFQP